jgi:hypothetical protein
MLLILFNHQILLSRLAKSETVQYGQRVAERQILVPVQCSGCGKKWHWCSKKKKYIYIYIYIYYCRSPLQNGVDITSPAFTRGYIV